jgi:chemotaxis protein CheC
MEVAGHHLREDQLRLLRTIFSKGAEDASRAMSKWLRGGVHLSVDEVVQVPFHEASGLFENPDELISACVMDLRGRMTGKLVLAFDDASGLALADILMDQPAGSAQVWTEIEQSAARETTNILGCAYLNSLVGHLPTFGEESELIPSPPELRRDFAGCLLEALVIDQLMVSDQLLLVRTGFERNGMKLHWQLILLPDLESFERIVDSLL